MVVVLSCVMCLERNVVEETGLANKLHAVAGCVERQVRRSIFAGVQKFAEHGPSFSRRLVQRRAGPETNFGGLVVFVELHDVSFLRGDPFSLSEYSMQ